MKRQVHRLLVSAMLLSCSAGMAMAAEIRIVPGDDVDAAVRTLNPGDTLVVSSGIYTKGWTISGVLGTSARPTTIRGEKGAVIRPIAERDGIVFWGEPSSGVLIEGLRIEGARRGGIVVGGSSNITIRDCVLVDNGMWGIQTCLSDRITVENCSASESRKQHGIYFSATDHPIARNCRVFNNAGCGIHMNGAASEGGDGMIGDGLIEDNLIYGNGQRGGAAINMVGVEKTIVRNNLIHDNLAGGIVTFNQGGAHSGSGNRFLNNTVYFAPGKGRYGLAIENEAWKTVSMDNTLVCGKGAALKVDAESLKGLTGDRNVYFVHGGGKPITAGWRNLDLREWQETTGQDRHSVYSNPAYSAEYFEQEATPKRLP